MDGRTVRYTLTTQTAEGDKPYKELIELLKTAKPLPELKLDTSTA